jgi:hypothetical protein
VGHVDVHVVGLEALEAGLQRRLDALPGEAAGGGLSRLHLPAQLGREQDLPAPLAQDAAEHGLGGAAAVDVRGIDEVHAGVEGEVEEAARRLLVYGGGVHPVRAPVHGAQGQDAYFQALTAQSPFLHDEIL